MAEQTFRSPGFFEQEIDLSGRRQSIQGTPAGVVGTAEKGPAFVPITVGTFADFKQVFGDLDAKRAGPYAAQKFLENRTALTYTRVLGAGANTSTSDIENTAQWGTVTGAGFYVSASAEVSVGGNSVRNGAVMFIVGKHTVATNEQYGMPLFTDNSSFDTSGDLNIVRGMLMLASGTRAGIMAVGSGLAADINTADSVHGVDASGEFALFISSSTSTSFTNRVGTARGYQNVKIYTASLDPSSKNYFGKLLNTDPGRFQEEEHVLYADFAVENELATLNAGSNATVAIVTGSTSTSANSQSDLEFLNMFGRFDTRYTTAKTTQVISQPFGGVEHDLFHFEALDDGQWANDKVKISIANLKASTDPKNKYGTFEVQVRRFSDTDTKSEILEAFPEVSLDPNDERYIARIMGDKGVRYDFDAENDDEKRLVITGKYPNVSQWVRVIVRPEVERKEIPPSSLPFGFRGIPTLKTNDALTEIVSGDSFSALTDDEGNAIGDSGVGRRLVAGEDVPLSGSIVPPLPFRFKVTRGAVSTAGGLDGAPGTRETADARLYWGVKFERVPEEATVSDAVLNANASSLPNPLIDAYTKFIGVEKLDTLVTGSGADYFNNNKFTLARVALGNKTTADVTGSASEHMLEAAYIRNGVVSAVSGTVIDSTGGDRVTLATLVNSSSVVFNRFTGYAKFSMPMHGGFDGLNILDSDVGYMNDRASSTESGGKAGSTVNGGLGLANTADNTMSGRGLENSTVASYRSAVQIMTDPFNVNTNILAIPGIRDPFITDYAGDKTREYSKAIYLMDVPAYGLQDGTTSTRLFAGDTLKPDVRETVEQFAGRATDNNYVSTYFPDVVADDTDNNRRVIMPASIAALAALGFNDKVSYPWFAPAGFNRGALDFVVNTETRLTQADRDNMYDNRINPIANFPNSGFAIFGQKTLQQAQTSLNRVNVRRMLLEVKRIVEGIAEGLLFEQNNQATRNRFINQVTPQLALVQAQQGIDSFKVVMDNTNNTQEDVESNKLNGRIVLVPTRTIEFIAVDFIITNAGVSFE